jgi:hypothetical protein
MFGSLLMAFDLLMAETLLRLACQIANDSVRLPAVSEGLLFGISAVVLLAGDVFIASLCSSFAFAFASIPITRMPLRS